jgi:hypothetical protein
MRIKVDRIQIVESIALSALGRVQKGSDGGPSELIGNNRVTLFVCGIQTCVMQGTWGTRVHGEILDMSNTVLVESPTKHCRAKPDGCGF